MKDSSKIVYNTVIVYGQLVITTIISLFVTRYVLKALGEEDYGIYMLVAGVVAMLNVFSSSLSNTAMRYMGHSLGLGDKEAASKTFNTTVSIHIKMGIVVVIILELMGLVMFKWFLNIPETKIMSAEIVYQCMIATTLITILAVPYDAVINAHENLLFLSVVNVIDIVLKLVLAIVLLTFGGNRLVFYGACMLGIQVIVRLIKQIYSRFKYEECKIKLRKYKDSSLQKSIVSFTGWELFASVASICQSHLRGILMNVFFGVGINAAEGIGKKVNSHVNMVSVGITKSITPQMNKSEGEGKRGRMIMLAKTGAKFTSFMFALFAVPIIIEADYLLRIWLDDVPAFAVIFCQLSMLMQLIDKLTWQLGNAIRAVGRNRELQVISGSLAIIGIIVAFFIFKIGGGPITIYFVEIGVLIVQAMARLILGKSIAGINPWNYIKTACMPVVLSMAAALIPVIVVRVSFEESFVRMASIFLIFMIVSTALFYFKGINSIERDKIKDMVSFFVKKYGKK